MVDVSREKWTFETLKGFLEVKIDSLKDNVGLALLNSDKAIDKAEKAINERLAVMNELRSVVEDRDRTFLPRQEYNVQHQALVEKVDALIKQISSIESTSKGRASGFSTIGAIVAAVITAIGVLGTLVIALTAFRH